LARPHQELRPSQFVITYGPGSIVETGSGPVVVKSVDTLFNEIGRSPRDFEVLDERLSRLELGGARITRVPSNAELDLPSDRAIYPTDALPYWALCAHHRPHQVLYEAGGGCPECTQMSQWHRREKAGREAIRFVLACENGHLDDVNWHSLVHQRGGRCGTRNYLWHGGGRALRLVRIECPRCHDEANFGQAYGRAWRCSGRLAELGTNRATAGAQCGADAHIIQRGAANLRQAVLRSALTIMDMPARLHNVLGDVALLGAVGALDRRGLLDHATLLEEASRANLSPDAVDYLRVALWADIRAALDGLLGLPGAPGSIRDDELDRLSHAASHGVPAVPHPQRGSPPLFEVRLQDVRLVQGPERRVTLRVAPVSRLRMVMVQIGYQRLDPQAGQVVPTSFDWNGVTWYPGIELFGEGIFIEIADTAPALSGDRVDVWQRRHDPDPQANLQLHPVHVWWHSLSHRLLWALSVDSGYSSTAIRERVYLRTTGGRGTRSGLLLYTVQPGGDGTMGGLVAMVSRFDTVLTRALQDVDTCSNDPLCEEAPTVGADGAACYSCLFASETSCEHHNKGLDRLLLRDNVP
jgi:hypothetical protein